MHCLIGEGTRSEKPLSEIKHSYKVDLLDRLKDLQYAQLYLDAAAKESQETFLLALRDVAEAQKGMSQLAEEADVNRENLYRALSEDGNPRLSTLGSVLDALGMEWGITLKHTRHLGRIEAQSIYEPTTGTMSTNTSILWCWPPIRIPFARRTSSLSRPQARVICPSDGMSPWVGSKSTRPDSSACTLTRAPGSRRGVVRFLTFFPSRWLQIEHAGSLIWCECGVSAIVRDCVCSADPT